MLKPRWLYDVRTYMHYGGAYVDLKKNPERPCGRPARDLFIGIWLCMDRTVCDTVILLSTLEKVSTGLLLRSYVAHT